jgi:lysophospholipase L1-like esterase
MQRGLLRVRLSNAHGSRKLAVGAARIGLRAAGLKQLAVRARTRGIKIFAATLTPYENETFLPGAWTPEREAKRRAVNAWIRDGGAFDAVVDFDKALRDPAHPTRMLPIYDCGDHLHPSDLGYCAKGDAVDLALFD